MRKNIWELGKNVHKISYLVEDLQSKNSVFTNYMHLFGVFSTEVDSFISPEDWKTLRDGNRSLMWVNKRKGGQISPLYLKL